MSWDRHPHVDGTRNLAERIVDGMGTTRFLLYQTSVVLAWVAFNILALNMAFDPYPFILLNLAFSTQAAYATPLLLMAGRSADRRNAEQALSAHLKLVALEEHNAKHVDCDCHG